MSEIIEEFFNGYCKSYDMARTAIGEFSEENGALNLEQIVIMENVHTVKTVK